MIGIFFKLTKALSAACIAASGVAGFCLGGGRNPLQSLWLFSGLLLLAMGAGALNQVQEIELDRKMNRTKHRPLPMGEVSPRCACAISLALLFAGLGLLLVFQGNLVGFLGILGAGLYNGVYTSIKTKVSWAIFPGALAGCVPPLMGFFAGGGPVFDRMVLLLFGVSYFWQIAHFCFLILAYKNEYEVSEDKNLYKEIGIRGVGILSIACMGACLVLVFGNCLLPPSAHPGFPVVLAWSGICLVFSLLLASVKKTRDAGFFQGAFLVWNAFLGGGILSIVQGCF
ncbi:MAG: UbiA family prenyltransferase [Candidatus Ozemobacteraceae bacterium]